MTRATPGMVYAAAMPFLPTAPAAAATVTTASSTTPNA
jgi:hypothetical protein